MTIENQKHDAESREKKTKSIEHSPSNEYKKKQTDHTESRKPRDEKDTQSKLSKDPTRKNEAQQGESDLRKRE